MSRRKRKGDNDLGPHMKSSKLDLMNKLSNLGINVPSTFTKSQMEALLNENDKSTDNTDIAVPIDDANNVVSDNNTSNTGNSDMRELISTVRNLSETVKKHGELLENRMNIPAAAESENSSYTNVFS